jgi:membrane associated rhomboid family serine protease
VFPIKDIIPPRRVPRLSLALTLTALVAIPALWGLGVLEGLDTTFAAIGLIYLVIFADNVEDRLGPLRFLVIAIAAGVTGSVVARGLGADVAIALSGAHAAVAGIVGSYVVLYPTSRVLLLVALPLDAHELPAILVAGFFFSLHATAGATALATAAAGCVAGVLLTLGLKRPVEW